MFVDENFDDVLLLDFLERWSDFLVLMDFLTLTFFYVLFTELLIFDNDKILSADLSKFSWVEEFSAIFLAFLLLLLVA